MEQLKGVAEPAEPSPPPVKRKRGQPRKPLPEHLQRIVDVKE
jgi:hypothetical protein